MYLHWLSFLQLIVIFKPLVHHSHNVLCLSTYIFILLILQGNGFLHCQYSDFYLKVCA